MRRTDHHEDCVCNECLTPATELDKTIERACLRLNEGRDIHPLDIQQLITAAKRLKEVERENDEEIAEFQNKVKNLIDELAGSNVDGAGCDSGDWRDFTLSEIGQGLAHVIDERDEIKKELNFLKTCDVVKFFNDLQQQLYQLRVEYKKVLKELIMAQSDYRRRFSMVAGELKTLKTPYDELLSTPLAIATMKGE